MAEVGLDRHKTRSWLGWHHQMLLSFLAHHCLVRLQIQLNGLASALTIYWVIMQVTNLFAGSSYEAWCLATLTANRKSSVSS